jgi:membrane carboxypeptidase/penicillin-binding protein
MALGAGETTLLRMTTAYSILDNGGKKIQPTLIDRVQDRYGIRFSAMTSAIAPAARPRPGNTRPSPSCSTSGRK